MRLIGSNKGDDYNKRLPILGFLIGVAIFIMIYGVKVLNPFYTDWLLCLGDFGDLQQHYLGWEFYRRGAWTFPIGLTDKLAYPVKTSVVFTDSIPIFAVIFKCISSFLPKYFQYFGWWGILCFGLQGYFATKIYKELGVRWYNIIVGDVIIITAPIVLYRMFMQTALGSQWIILAAMYIFMKHDDYYRKKEAVIYWGILGFLTVGIHIYFFPICFPFVVGYVIKSIIDEKKIKIIYIFPAIIYILSACINIYILGGFAPGFASGDQGFTECSFNLNAFINPWGYSRILPDLKMLFVQREGFAYLGLGLICIVVIGIIRFFFCMTIKKCSSLEIIIFCIGLVFLIIAVSPVVTFGDKILVEIQVPEIISKIGSIFRATGRFVWPVWYMLAVYGIKQIENIRVGRRKNIYVSGGILVICLCIQLFDISPALIKRHETFTEDIVYVYNDDEFWEQLANFRQFKHLCNCNPHVGHEVYYKLTALALRYDWTMNGFRFARENSWAWDNQETLQRGDTPASDSIYILYEEQVDLLKDCEHHLKYFNVGEFIVGVTWLDDEGNVNDFSYD